MIFDRTFSRKIKIRMIGEVYGTGFITRCRITARKVVFFVEDIAHFYAHISGKALLAVFRNAHKLDSRASFGRNGFRFPHFFIPAVKTSVQHIAPVVFIERTAFAVKCK